MKRSKRRHVLAIILRDAAGLTQGEVARNRRRDRSTISRLESGEVENDELLFELIELYGGIPLIDRLLEILRRARDWYETRERYPVLYA